MGTMLLLALSSPWQVVYVARVYYPAGDRRTSHHQVYLSDLHGGHRRQVTTGVQECAVVRWLDPSTIAWTRLDGTLWRMRVDGGRPKLWRRTKAELASVSIGEGLRTPGHPVLPLDRPYRYIAGKLVPFTAKTGWWVGAARGTHLTYRPGTLKDDAETYGELSVPPDGRPLLPLDDGLVQPVTAWSGPGPDDRWVLFGTSMSSRGEYHDLVRYDRKTGKVLWHRGEIGDLDFRPDRTLYARRNSRSVEPFGELQVWTAPIFVGDWKTGREWRLPLGTAEGWSVSLRPER